MNDKLNLSVDLRRVCSWILKERDDLVDKMLDRDIKLYSDKNYKVGNYRIDEWLVMIKNRMGGREQAAERALTASVILAR